MSANGQLSAGELAPIAGGGWLRKDAAAAWNAMEAASRRQLGYGLKATDSYRPLGRPGDLARGVWSQWAAWERYQQGGSLAAHPGTSNHGWGLAVDVTQQSRTAIDRIGHAFGWAKEWSDASSEWWHLAWKTGVWRPPVVTNDVFRGKGMWIWEGTKSDPEQLCARLASAGYQWITVKAQDGGSPFGTNAGVMDAYRAAAGRHKLRFTLWGYLYAAGATPEQEARLAVNFVARYGAAGFIADVETEYERAAGPVSRRFCDTFRQLAATMPLACSSFGRVDLHMGIDWGAWAAAGAVWMPQAYVCESEALDPRRCVEAAERYWPVDRQYVTVGAYRGVRGMLSGAQLAAGVRGLGVAGVNLWDAQECTLDQLTADYGHWADEPTPPKPKPKPNLEIREESDMANMVEATNADGRPEVFDLVGGRPRHKWIQPDGAWSGWAWIYPNTTQRFATLMAFHQKDGRIELLGKTSKDGVIMHTWQQKPNGSWNGAWTNL